MRSVQMFRSTSKYDSRRIQRRRLPKQNPPAWGTLEGSCFELRPLRAHLPLHARQFGDVHRDKECLVVGEVLAYLLDTVKRARQQLLAASAQMDGAKPN
jgi:hypothetical protein